MLKNILLLFVFNLSISPLIYATERADTVKVPVFLIGENDIPMEEMNKEYPALLLEVLGDDMDKAYSQWQKVINGMEKYAVSIDFNLKGVSMWINIYWRASGKIDYIGYFLKPDSRNVRTAEMNAFLKAFIKQDKIHLAYSSGYFHNGSVSFPTHFNP